MVEKLRDWRSDDMEKRQNTLGSKTLVRASSGVQIRRFPLSCRNLSRACDKLDRHSWEITSRACQVPRQHP
ncbi:unnamed protein product [Leuciscus chuanchicus]